MNTARLVSWVGNIEMLVPFLVVISGGVGWLLLRKRKTSSRRSWRLGFVVAAVVCFQLLITHNIYMKGFDHGMAGQHRDEAYLSFFHTASYIAEDLHVYDNPFLQLLYLFAANSAFLWLLGRERREAAERLAIAQHGKGEPPPET